NDTPVGAARVGGRKAVGRLAREDDAPMLSNITPAGRHALRTAEDLARGLPAADVQPVPLLQALPPEGEGRAAALPTWAGLDIAAARQRRRPETAAPAPARGRTPLPLDAAAQRVLGHARQMASEFSENRTVASEHLLLALLRDDEGLRRELQALGL